MHPSGDGLEDPPTPGDGSAYGRGVPPRGPVLLDGADVEAWNARKDYPATLCAGGPVFGVARELGDGRWALHADVTALTAQDAREALAAHVRVLTAAAHEAGDAHAVEAYGSAVDLLEAGEADEAAAAGARHRVIRADRFIRMGPDGPEPPRPGDLLRAAAPAAPDPLVLDPARPADAFSTVLQAELLAALRPVAAVTPRIGEDARRATRTHPRAVLLPPTFMTAEREPGGRWRPHSTGTATTPREARAHLALHLRFAEPWQRELSAAQHAAYEGAADRLQAEQCDRIDVDGRHFRVIRVERLLRIGPDGPEPPRPSDPVPPPPPPLTDADLDRFRAKFTMSRLTAGSSPPQP